MIESIQSASIIDSNVKLVSININRADMFYNPYTAGYAILSRENRKSINLKLKIESVPLSLAIPSEINYDDMDLEAEKLTSLIFMKSVGDLEPHEFIRSPIFRFFIDGSEYNHFLVGPFEIAVHFNKIHDFPDFDITEEETARIHAENELKLNITDASNYYCLGTYNELTRSWSCASRKILSISENIIEFSVVTTGVFAVLYYPRTNESASMFCGWLCRNKRAIITFFVIILPILVIGLGWIISLLIDIYFKLEKKIISASKSDQESPFKNAIEKVETDDENIPIESMDNVYNNPLLFRDGQNIDDIRTLKNKKMQFRFRDEKLMVEKVEILKRSVNLRDEIELLNDRINMMKKLQGLDLFKNTSQN